LEFHHVEEILALTASEPTRSERVVELPHGWEAVLSGRELRLRARCLTTEELAQAYECPLPVPGEARVAGRKIRAKLQPLGAEAVGAAAPPLRVLLDPTLVERPLLVRSWRPGDRYWPEHTHSPKKLKELLQAAHIPRSQKPSWPVVVSGEEIVWVPGFAPPERFRVREGSPAALLLEQLPLQSGTGNET
jgi:tRNA(Ile)-lysidine synthase